MAGWLQLGFRWALSSCVASYEESALQQCSLLPWRASGRSADGDRSIAVLPHLHSRAARHPDEATIAKRRAHAPTLACPIPPVENAGLYKGLSGLDGRATASQGLREELQHGVAIVSSIVAAAGQRDSDEGAEDSPEGTVRRSTLC